MADARPVLRPLIALLTLVLLAPVAALAKVSLSVSPEWPSASDPVDITIEYETYDLCAEPQLTVNGRTLAIEFVCQGPVHVLGQPKTLETRTFRVGPLDPGVYAVEAAIISSVGPVGIRRIAASQPLSVIDFRFAINSVVTEPALPTEDNLAISLLVRTICPTSFSTIGVAGSTILLYGRNAEACPGPDLAEQRVPLGQLPAGDYTALFLTDEASSAPTDQLAAAFPFRVGRGFRPNVTLGGEARFAVEAMWTKPDGDSDSARGQLLEGADDSATFYFFRPGNRELMIKVLDGCESNGFYWVFLGGLTNLGVEVTVTDTVDDRSRAYTNPVGTPFQPFLDTRAFACE